MDYRKEIQRLRTEREQKKKRKRIVIIFILTVIIVLLVCAIMFIIDHTRQEKNTSVVIQTPTVTEPIVTKATIEPTPDPTAEPVQRRGIATDIPASIRITMDGYSMPENASIEYDELSYLTIPHYDFGYNIVEGHLVVNKMIAEEVLDIFADLFDVKYPIERMELIDKYDADDYISIDYNNTSAFNYRESTDGSGKLSKHALGLAIDINPQINPYVNSDGTGAHQNAMEYWSRDVTVWTSEIAKAAYIGLNTDIYKIFVDKYGWEWGGSWTTYRDYQHFQKDVN